MESICDTCRAIDFASILDIPTNELRADANWSGCRLLDQGANRFDDPSIAETTCPLCRILAKTLCPCESEWDDNPVIREHAAQTPYELWVVSFLLNCRWAALEIQGAQDCRMLLSTRGVFGSMAFEQFVKKDLGFIACLPKHQKPGLFLPQMIPESFDAAKAKLWVQNCRDHHGDSCNRPVEPVGGMKVIDCEDLAIVPIQPDSSWVALSYTWGRTSTSPRDNQADIPGSWKPKGHVDPDLPRLPSNVSATIKHAVQVTRDLGYRYLWVDRYCIDQLDTAQKQHQIAHMDTIYRGADLTIVAAASHNEDFGLPGVGLAKRREQLSVDLGSCTLISTGPDPVWETQQSRWWSRGWTFQESLLSRRLLIFTESQSWFECGKASWMDAMGGLEVLDNPHEAKWTSERLVTSALVRGVRFFHRNRLDVRISMLENVRLDQFFAIAKMYTDRNLTFDSDAHHAFAGVSRHIRNSETQVSHIYGIPYIASILGSERAPMHMFFGLSWFHRPGKAPRRRRGFPSWSWMGWDGACDWVTRKYFGAEYTRPKMRNIGFQGDQNDDIIPMDIYLTALDSSGYHPNGGQLVVSFEAPLVPPSIFTFWVNEDGAESNLAEDELVEETSDGNKPKGPDFVGATMDADKLGFSPAQPVAGNGNALPRDTEEKCSEVERGESGVGNGDKAEHDPNETTSTGYADPYNWDDWRFGIHPVWDRSQAPDCDPLTFQQRLESGEWSCLLLGDYHGKRDQPLRRFLLVVEWLPDGWAHRVGSIALDNNEFYKIDSAVYSSNVMKDASVTFDDYKVFFDADEFEWASVRLV